MKNRLLKLTIMVSKQVFLWTIIVLITAGTLVANSGNAQDKMIKSVKDNLITLQLSNATIIDILQTIEVKTGYKFTYDKSEIDKKLRMSLQFDGEPVEKVLLEISKNARLRFRQVNNNIHIKRMEPDMQHIRNVEVVIQTKNVTGNVMSPEGETLPGVNVIEKGTNNGTVTDIDGNYSLNVGEDAILLFSFVGYRPVEQPVGNQSVINVTLAFDVTALEEIVVVGYGFQRERDLTTAITSVKSDELTKTPTSQAMQALQGKIAGVQIVNNGAPGGSPTVRIRGISSIEGTKSPLYVVDGMFFKNIDFLNPNDIETLSVLKDASAAAIYGVRAANGVILIETKSGSYNQDPEIVYDGYYGLQIPQNVVKMSNSQQFVQYVTETGDPADMSFVNAAMQRYGRSRINPNVPDVNTDWFAEIMEPASIQSHNLSFNGGSEKTRYSIGGGYFSQDGLLQDARNSYNRLSLRLKLDTDVKDWLSIGGNLNVSVARQYEANNGAWFSAYFAVPIMPVYDDQNTEASPFMLSNARNLGYRGGQNPFFNLLYSDDKKDFGTVLGNFNVTAYLIKDKLSFETVYNYSLSGTNRRLVNFPYNDGLEDIESAIRRESITSFNQVWDNYLTYRDNFDDHNITVVLGQSFRSEFAEVLFMRGTGMEIVRENEELWYMLGSAIDIGNIGDIPNNIGGNTSILGHQSLNGQLFYNSYFGRISYNYADRYLLYGTFRRDGNNKFQQKWANFSTIGAGWVPSEESFFNIGYIDFLKLRAGWGQLGNDGILPAVGKATLANAPITVINGGLVNTGLFLNPTYSLIDKPEITEEINIGLSARFLENRLSLEADYFIRNTRNLAITIQTPAIRDPQPVRRSIGEIQNKGMEIMLNWEDNISDDFSYSIGGNFATLKNEVVGLGGASGIDGGSAEFRQRSIIGEPFEAFFGYEVVGVFQNEEQIASSGYTQEFINSNNLVPGDLFFRDQNGDGEINDEDRVVLGSYLPDYTYGFDIGVSYRNLNLTANFQGQAGNKILNRKRGEIIFTNDTNLDAELVNNLWRGEGTSNKYPSAVGLRRGWNQYMSDFYVEDGSYFRVQNVRLSYKVLDKAILGANIPDALITFTAERPLTLFNYNGFNPEVADGIDRQIYPIPAVYTIGLNLTL